MDFGRVEYSQLDHINFKLPKEPYANSNVLKGRNTHDCKFYVGLSKWGKKEWIGKLYPKGTREANFLDEYVKHYNCVELNATHYKLYNSEGIQKWVAKVKHTSFKFCPKVYQGISHFGSFNDKQFLTNTFLDSMKCFGKHLGPMFLQVSDKFGPKRKEELYTYLSTLTKEISIFQEVRHEDWFESKNAEDLFAKLRKLRIGSVITDAAGRRDVAHMHITAPKTMIRFIGNDLHPSDFTRLDEWVSRIKYWVDSGLEEVYFFLHCLDETFAPELSQYLIKQLNEECGAGLKEIEFIC